MSWERYRLNLGFETGASIFSVLWRGYQLNHRVLGTAFLIAHDEDGLLGICLGAKHVFDEIVDMHVEDPGRRMPMGWPSNRGIGSNPGEYTFEAIPPSGGASVAVTMSAQTVFADVLAVSSIPEKDLALFLVKLRTDQPIRFRNAIPLSLSCPAPGTRVLIAAYDAQRNTHSEGGHRIGTQIFLTRKFVARGGHIVESYPEGAGLVRGHALQTNIPCTGGMSGAPVFLSDNFPELSICGIVSTDMSPTESFADNNVDGTSMISCANHLEKLEFSGRERRFLFSELLLPKNVSLLFQQLPRR